MDVYRYREQRAHANFVLTGLNLMRREYPNLCDFTIKTDDDTFPCHRSVLSLFSSYFKAAVDGGFKEKTENLIILQVRKTGYRYRHIVRIIWSHTEDL